MERGRGKERSIIRSSRKERDASAQFIEKRKRKKKEGKGGGGRPSSYRIGVVGRGRE